jgi:hypothetical protein
MIAYTIAIHIVIRLHRKASGAHSIAIGSSYLRYRLFLFASPTADRGPRTSDLGLWTSDFGRETRLWRNPHFPLRGHI